MSKSENEAVARGREAWGRLKKGTSWNDWMETGTALEIGRTECFAATHANDTNDKRYRNAFGAWLQANGFDDMDGAVRKRLFECMEHRSEIETWRAGLSMAERLKLNHPQSVLRKWQGSTSEGRATLPETKAAKPGLREEVARLQAELDEAQTKLRQAARDSERGPLLTPNAGINDAVAVLREYFSASKGAAIAAGWMASYKADKAAPRIKRGALA